MADYLVSVDPGNGGTNGVLAKEKGGYKSVCFPSVRASASGDTVDVCRKREMATSDGVFHTL